MRIEGIQQQPIGDESEESKRRKKELEERQTREQAANKPENLGFLAVGPEPDKPRSVFAEAWANTKREPSEDAEKPPERDEEEPAPPEIFSIVPPPEIAPAVPDEDEAAPPAPPAEHAAVEQVRHLDAEDEQAVPDRLEEQPPNVDQRPEETKPDENITAEASPVEVPTVAPVKVPESKTVDEVPEARPVEDTETEPPDSENIWVNRDESADAEAPEESPALETERGPEPAREPRPEPETELRAETVTGDDSADAEDVPAPPPQPEVAPAPPEAADHTADEQEQPVAKSPEEDVATPDETVTESDHGRPEPEQLDQRPFEFNEDTAQQPEDLPESAEPVKAASEAARKAEESRPTERLGHMLVNKQADPGERYQPAVETEAAPELVKSSRAAEEKMKVETAPKGPLAGRHIETLNRAELLAIAETISIDGSSLRQIYETHLIGERGLRRLVGEYQNGGDLHKALKHEVLERELDFERDPAMRGTAPPSVTSSDAPPIGADGQTLEKLLQKAQVSTQDSGERAAFLKARTRYEAANQRSQRQRYRTLADVAFFVIIGILALLVIIMYLRRA